MVFSISKLFRSTCYYLVTFNELIITLKLLKTTTNDGNENADSNTINKAKEKSILNDYTDTLKFWIVFAVFQTVSISIEKYTSRIPGYNYFVSFVIGLLLFPKLRIANVIYDDIVFKFYLACKHRLKAHKIHSISDLIHTLLLVSLVIVFPNIIHQNEITKEKDIVTKLDNSHQLSDIQLIPLSKKVTDDDNEFFMPHFENESSKKQHIPFNHDDDDDSDGDSSVDGFDIVKEFSDTYPLTVSDKNNAANATTTSTTTTTPLRMLPLRLANNARHKHVDDDDDNHENDNDDNESYQLLSYRSPSAKSHPHHQQQQSLHSPQSIQSRSRKSSMISNNSDHTPEINVTIRTPQSASATGRKRTMSVVQGISQSKSRLSQLTPFFNRLKESSSAIKEPSTTSVSAHKTKTTSYVGSDIDTKANNNTAVQLSSSSSTSSSSSPQRHSFFPKSTNLSFYINKTPPSRTFPAVTASSTSKSVNHLSNSLHTLPVSMDTTTSSTSSMMNTNTTMQQLSRSTSRSRDVPGTFPLIESANTTSSPSRSTIGGLAPGTGKVTTTTTNGMNSRSNSRIRNNPTNSNLQSHINDTTSITELSSQTAQTKRINGPSLNLQPARETSPRSGAAAVIHASSSSFPSSNNSNNHNSSNNHTHNMYSKPNQPSLTSDTLLHLEPVSLSLPLADETIPEITGLRKTHSNTHNNSNTIDVDASAKDVDGAKVTVRNRAKRLVKSVFSTTNDASSSTSTSIATTYSREDNSNNDNNNSSNNNSIIIGGVRTRSTGVNNSRNMTENKNKR